MGQRTQMLITIKETTGGDKPLGVSLHYQWGYGRVMLMDALNFAQALPDQLFRISAEDDADGAWRIDGAKLARWLSDHATGGTLNFYSLSPDGSVDDDILPGIEPFHETRAQMFEASDNDSGYAELTIIPKDGTSELRLFDRYGNQTGLSEYVRCGGGERFAPKEWQEHFEALLNSFDCRIRTE